MVTPTRAIVNGGRWQGLKDADAEEEAYFNGEEIEDDEEALAIGKDELAKPRINGASPVSKRLVDYPDDDDDAMDILATDAIPGRNTAPHLDSSDVKELHDDDPEDKALDDHQQKQAPTPPPERIAEKRRREEDEEDELGKLSGLGVSNKRRSSSSAGSDNSVTAQSGNAVQQTHFLRRKKSMTINKDGGGPKRISISIGGKGGGTAEKEDDGS